MSTRILPEQVYCPALLKILSAMRNSFVFILLAILSLFFFHSAKKTVDQSELAKEVVHHLFDDYHKFKLEINPLEATKGGYNEYNDQIANFISDEYQAKLIHSYQDFLVRANEIEIDLLSEADQMSLKVLIWDSQIKLEGLQNDLVTIASPVYDLPNFELMPIAQITSLQLYVSQLAGGQSVHPFKTPKDYEDWISRVDDYLFWIDTAILKMKDGMAKGIVLPKVLIDRVLDQLDPFIIPNVTEHLFYQPIHLMPDHFTIIDREPLTDAFHQMVSDRVIPKYRELRTFMKYEYYPSGLDEVGLSHLPYGKKTYDYLIRLHTSTNMSADEIHELGLSEVKRISGEMVFLKDEMKYEGDLKSFLDYMRNNEALTPFSQPEEIIGFFNNINEKIQPAIPELFANMPIGGFEVKRTEAFREQSASAEYVPGSKDGTRPGTFYVPIPDATQHSIMMDEALFLHEAIPGHHFQLSLQQENDDLPAFLHAEGMGVFVEGWALYAESLGTEMGLYTDPAQLFGMLSMEMHRAIRLVVDSGIHAKGWTREEAIAFSLEHEADSEASITSEVERYIATPGQALSYKIGQLTIRSLRDKAEQSLGEDFDIRSFHDQVLNSGSLPMHLLEEKIEKWIEASIEM